MLLSLMLFESEFLHIVAISYTALVLNELIMVALEITTWHSYMVLSEVGTAAVYFGSMAVLPAYFGTSNCACTWRSLWWKMVDAADRLQIWASCSPLRSPTRSGSSWRFRACRCG